MRKTQFLRCLTGLLGAALLAGAVLAFSSCKNPDPTEPWSPETESGELTPSGSEASDYSEAGSEETPTDASGNPADPSQTDRETDSETGNDETDHEPETDENGSVTETIGEITEDETSAQKLETPAAAWNLSDLKNSMTSPALKGGASGTVKWGVLLPSYTFGRVLDFSTDGSMVSVSDTKVTVSDAFTLSLFLRAPERETQDRVILDADSFKLSLKHRSGAGNTGFDLAFESGFITGEKALANCGLVDGKWHHLFITAGNGTVTVYQDGKKKDSFSYTGKFAGKTGALTIGADKNGKNGFDGSLAELRLFDRIVAREEATLTVIDTRDQAAQGTRFQASRGIAIDRRQYYNPTPYENEGQTVTEADIVNCINMGFDHVKLLLTPNPQSGSLVNADGSLNTAGLTYITKVVDYVKKHHYKCILCIHPEGNFKATYLGNLANFEKLIKWYGEFASYVGKHWDADTVAIQLMTEPGENNASVSWSWMSDRMWGAVRNVLPEHTIITSADSYGNLERVKLMSPASDPNLVYSFTTYEPYTIGWYYYNTSGGLSDGWAYVHDIPYPVEAGVDYSAAVEKAIDQVPAQWKAEMRKELTAYVKGQYDGKWSDHRNVYGGLYNAGWHMARAKSLDDWSKKYGGNIHLMCVEFGCMDSRTPAKLWKSAAPCFGISDSTRIQFTHDMRAAWDAYGIGWDYWSYNEAHTVFSPDYHNYGESPATDLAPAFFDYDMLEKGLNVRPKVARPKVNPVNNDPSWFVISNVETTDGWIGSTPTLKTDAPSGMYYLRSGSIGGGNDIVFQKGIAQQDISSYAGSDGYLHLWLYVSDVNALQGGQIELCSNGKVDLYETSWEVRSYVNKSGWNELNLPLYQAGKGTNPCDFKQFDTIRIYGIFTNQSAVMGIDHVYLYRGKDLQTDYVFPPFDRDLSSVSPWFGDGLSVHEVSEGYNGKWIASTTANGGAKVLALAFGTGAEADLSAFSGGSLHLFVYVEDISLITGGEIELTSSGGPDQQEIHWNVKDQITKNGWNELSLPLSSGIPVSGSGPLSGALNLKAVNYLRIYFLMGNTANPLVGIGRVSVGK